MLRKLNFERIGRNFFCPSKAQHISQHSLEVWPGFFTAMQKLEGGSLLMIDMTSKVIRNDSLLSHIKMLTNEKRLSKERINEEL